MAHNEKILDIQARIRARKLQLRSLWGTGIAATASSLGIYVATVATWRTTDLGQFNWIAIPLTIFCGLVCSVLWIVEDHREDRTPVHRIQVELDVAEERRLLEAFQLSVPASQRQFTYKDTLPRELERLREEAQHYRRIHNAFQSIIIMGSLGTTTAASLADTPSYLKWVTVGLSLGVGISAGFTGYFKYRERSFYLQQTADAIEQNANAFELGIPPYVGQEEENLSKLAQEVENLRVEQRKRQQQLDQPHEGRDGTV
ncbi:DUF4231 domain-containing protein [Actinacidiphila reveromycinica]|uniref:DUF4231 domain-containing protein n=1 Tax=Actinacidiphila reveromycinica TaxID=659352 RepID=UPI0019235EB2|nr:DUF4231 domain-containing protein [Streptomyces sp. SN-593]